MMRWSLAHKVSSPQASALSAIWSNASRPAASPRTTIDIPYFITRLPLGDLVSGGQNTRPGVEWRTGKRWEEERGPDRR